jgi:hypothetical protein
MLLDQAFRDSIQHRSPLVFEVISSQDCKGMTCLLADRRRLIFIVYATLSGSSYFSVAHALHFRCDLTKTETGEVMAILASSLASNLKAITQM